MKKLHLLLGLSVFLIASACTNEKHFLTDDAYRAEVEVDFNEKKGEMPRGNLFAVFDQSLTTEETEAMKFLYAYMPIGDVTDYDGQFYLDNVRASFRARQEMPWGELIPEGIFRHFVLPVRVNNENLDESRMVFYEELKDRVKDLSLNDAILEVNHWCHEKVIYTPSDARTSSALASVRTAYGRCGEESTFTVAAMRSVGIPARQVYTPRWAHTDDNHAWVEAWVDGKWKFLGACEPEPVLNLGWFNGPASRGMLMHTKAFGKYNGPEEVMEETRAYTEINVINNYAPTARVDVTVVDRSGKSVSGANVEFKIYNYAEFYSVANKKTNAEGMTFLSAGKGDMLVWVTKDGYFGYQKISFGGEENITITLDKKPGDTEVVDLDIVPPVEGNIPAEVTPEQRAENDRRMQEEDDIRNTYVGTFYTEEKARVLATELGTDEALTIQYMIGSRGNWREIETFLKESTTEQRAMAMELLGVISAKDLRDTPASVLADHLNHAPKGEGEFFVRYILNPRVSNELLTAYRKIFIEQAGDELTKKATENPQVLIEWVRENITILDALNPQRIPVMPMGVWNGHVADAASRNVFFIALARSLGIPARIEPVARKVQYNRDDKWIDVDFETGGEMIAKQGKVQAAYKAIKTLDDPKYHSHFTVAKILPDGKLQTLNLRGRSNTDMGGGNSWSTIMKKPYSLDEGNYVMVTGSRMANGSVLSNLTFFHVEAGKETKIDLVMRENADEVSVIGSFNSENKFIEAESGKETSVLLTTGRGYFVIGILGSRQEPTNHAMRDIAAVKADLEAWGRGMVLLFPDEQGYKNFDPKEFGNLPNTITYGIDTNNQIQKEIAEAMKLSNSSALPIFIIGDTFNRVVFVSQGYTIGLGEQLMKVIHKL